MKLKNLAKQYRAISKEMKREAENYNYLSRAVRSSHSHDTFIKYNESWKKLLRMNEAAYKVMYEYRSLCNRFSYRVLFFIGILPKQNTFRFVDDTKTWFNYDQMINLLKLA